MSIDGGQWLMCAAGLPSVGEKICVHSNGLCVSTKYPNPPTPPPPPTNTDGQWKFLGGGGAKG